MTVFGCVFCKCEVVEEALRSDWQLWQIGLLYNKCKLQLCQLAAAQEPRGWHWAHILMRVNPCRKASASHIGGSGALHLRLFVYNGTGSISPGAVCCTYIHVH